MNNQLWSKDWYDRLGWAYLGLVFWIHQRSLSHWVLCILRSSFYGCLDICVWWVSQYEHLRGRSCKTSSYDSQWLVRDRFRQCKGHDQLHAQPTYLRPVVTFPSIAEESTHGIWYQTMQCEHVNEQQWCSRSQATLRKDRLHLLSW